MNDLDKLMSDDEGAQQKKPLLLTNSKPCPIPSQDPLTQSSLNSDIQQLVNDKEMFSDESEKLDATDSIVDNYSESSSETDHFLDMDEYEEAMQTRLFLCFKTIGKRRKKNNLSSKFDDVHQEFVVQNTPVTPFEQDFVPLPPACVLDNPATLSWKQIYLERNLISEVYGHSIHVYKIDGVRTIC